MTSPIPHTSTPAPTTLPWRERPELLLLIATFAMALAMALWTTLLNNFVVESFAFTGKEIGVLHSIREIPGFLAFTAVFVLILLREQHFFLISLLLAGIGLALTGLLPGIFGVYTATVLMSIGFHYFETLKLSLTLQWVDKARSPIVFGQQVSAASLASALVFLVVLVFFDNGFTELADLIPSQNQGTPASEVTPAQPYIETYLIVGGLIAALCLACFFLFPQFPVTRISNQI
nr:hypothetical protein [Alphaproteobacteria bacterium]